MASRMERTGKGGALLFFGVFLLMLGLVGGVIALFAALEGEFSAPINRLLSVVFAFGILAMSVLVMGVPFVAVYFWARRSVKHATLLARPVTGQVEATMTTQCTQCGAHLSALAVGTATAVPCPYCQTPLAPPEGMRDVVQCTLAALAAQERAAASAELRQSIEALGRNARYAPKKLKGLDFEFAGAMATGSHDGVPMWSADDYLAASYMIRLEVDHETRFGGSIWFAPQPLLETHWAVAGELGVLLPTNRITTGDQQIDSRFVVMADDDVSATQLVSEQGFRLMLLGLGPDESLVIDGAGLSFYRTGTFWKVTRSGGIPAFLKKHAPNAAWLVKAMARSATSNGA